MTKTKLKAVLRGAWKSATMQFSTILVAIGGLEQYSGTLTSWVGSKYAGLLIMVVGILSMVLRAKTRTSLQERGSK